MCALVGRCDSVLVGRCDGVLVGRCVCWWRSVITVHVPAL